MRATRGIDQMRRAQKETVGLATGPESKRKSLGLPENPSDRAAPISSNAVTKVTRSVDKT
jgi:hypothetical protein